MRCDHCPTPPGLDCVGEEASRLCDLCAPGGEHFKAGYAAVVADQSAMERVPDVPPPEPAEAVPATVPPPSYPPGLGAVLGCPSRKSSCHCLDRPAHCLRDRRRTTLDRCLACVDAFAVDDRGRDSGARSMLATDAP